jgi:hypothetical protein
MRPTGATTPLSHGPGQIARTRASVQASTVTDRHHSSRTPGWIVLVTSRSATANRGPVAARRRLATRVRTITGTSVKARAATSARTTAMTCCPSTGRPGSVVLSRRSRTSLRPAATFLAVNSPAEASRRWIPVRHTGPVRTAACRRQTLPAAPMPQVGWSPSARIAATRPSTRAASRRPAGLVPMGSRISTARVRTFPGRSMAGPEPRTAGRTCRRSRLMTANARQARFPASGRSCRRARRQAGRSRHQRRRPPDLSIRPLRQTPRAS